MDNNNKKNAGSESKQSRKPLRLSKESLKDLRVRTGCQAGAAFLSLFECEEGGKQMTALYGC